MQEKETNNFFFESLIIYQSLCVFIYVISSNESLNQRGRYIHGSAVCIIVAFSFGKEQCHNFVSCLMYISFNEK